MNYKVKGTITKIGEKKLLDNGAVVLDYVVEETSQNGYVTPFSFNIYKGADYADFVDKFIEFNKVGDNVEVEFTIRGKEYNGRIYNSLSHWRCDQVGGIPTQEPTPIPKEQESDLPF